jgi:hypothetical protein
VTNNNGFWIWWLDLLALLLQLQPIITAHNQWLPKTGSNPSWITSVFSSTVSNDDGRIASELVLGSPFYCDCLERHLSGSCNHGSLYRLVRIYVNCSSRKRAYRTVAYQWTSASVRCYSAFRRCLLNLHLAIVIFVTITTDISMNVKPWRWVPRNTSKIHSVTSQKTVRNININHCKNLKSYNFPYGLTRVKEITITLINFYWNKLKICFHGSIVDCHSK